LPVDLQLEVTFDDVDRLGLVAVSVSRQGQPAWGIVNEEAERAAGVIRG
jgi:hypothetical protein